MSLRRAALPGDAAAIAPTRRLYLEDDRCHRAEATVVAVREAALACDRTCFYPGGGGQPPDTGSVALADGTVLAVTGAHADADGVVWHATAPPPPAGAVGRAATLAIDGERRDALARYHTVLHVLNTVALRDHGGWITGAQIRTDYARIDFNLPGLPAALCDALERKVNAVLAANHPLRAYYVEEAEFARRTDLLRTLEARPPVVDGRVRVVEIAGFDAQACGGTHVAGTAEVGQFAIFRTENKGRNNKRLYVRLGERPK